MNCKGEIRDQINPLRTETEYHLRVVVTVTLNLLVKSIETPPIDSM